MAVGEPRAALKELPVEGGRVQQWVVGQLGGDHSTGRVGQPGLGGSGNAGATGATSSIAGGNSPSADAGGHGAFASATGGAPANIEISGALATGGTEGNGVVGSTGRAGCRHEPAPSLGGGRPCRGAPSISEAPLACSDLRLPRSPAGTPRTLRRAAAWASLAWQERSPARLWVPAACPPCSEGSEYLSRHPPRRLAGQRGANAARIQALLRPCAARPLLASLGTFVPASLRRSPLGTHRRGQPPTKRSETRLSELERKHR